MIWVHSSSLMFIFLYSDLDSSINMTYVLCRAFYEGNFVYKLICQVNWYFNFFKGYLLFLFVFRKRIGYSVSANINNTYNNLIRQSEKNNSNTQINLSAENPPPQLIISVRNLTLAKDVSTNTNDKILNSQGWSEKFPISTWRQQYS